ncbi:MAG: hypothetical protein FJ029_15790, partial [Actinobacteria bacterium]|nr:hypothetical protein [Actinomycetota bacterium]
MPERKDLSRRDLLLLAGHIGMAGALLPASAAATPDKANPFLQHGFAPVLDELAVAELTVRGELPRQI